MSLNMSLKRWVSLAVVLLLIGVHAAFASSAAYDVDPNHSSISFAIRHMMSTVNGNFTQFSGSINYDSNHPANSSVNFKVDAASVTTQNPRRDSDLKSPNFFDVAQFPEAMFQSTKVVPLGNNQAKVFGNLTIHGVTKNVVFDVSYLGTMKDPWGGQRAGFSASTVVNRKDFGIVWNKVLDNGGTLVGDTATLKVDVEAVLHR